MTKTNLASFKTYVVHRMNRLVWFPRHEAGRYVQLVSSSVEYTQEDREREKHERRREEGKANERQKRLKGRHETGKR